MSDSTINVSGADQAYAIDAVQVEGGDYRQVLALGDFTNSGVDGSMATVAASALRVRPVDGSGNTAHIQPVSSTINASHYSQCVRSVLTGMKPDTSYGNVDITTEGNLKISLEETDTAVEVGIKPGTTNLSFVHVDKSNTGDIDVTDSEIIAAPGAGNKIVVYGVQGTLAAGVSSAFGFIWFTDGAKSGTSPFFSLRTQGTTPVTVAETFPYGVALTENTALNFSGDETSGQLYFIGTIYYKTETV